MGSRMEIGQLDDTGLKMTENLLWVEFLVKKDDKKKKEPISSFFFHGTWYQYDGWKQVNRMRFSGGGCGVGGRMVVAS